MKALAEQTIGEIVAADYRRSDIFRSSGIDFCCHGDRTIEEACSKTDTNPDELIAELESLNGEKEQKESHDSWSLGFLVDHITSKHHPKTREALSEIQPYAKKVTAIHGSGDAMDMYEGFVFHSTTHPTVRVRHEELIDIYQEVTKLVDTLREQMDNQENKLFPFIKKQVDDHNDLGQPKNNHFAEMIEMMRNTNGGLGSSLKNIRTLSNGFAPPADACKTYCLYFEKLQAFESDLQKQIHLENNILLPKVLKLIEN